LSGIISTPSLLRSAMMPCTSVLLAS
jgi:hypothetical protein